MDSIGTTAKQPPLALLVDLDGPLANPTARTVIEPTIFPSIRALLLAGLPVVINTGRSAQYVLDHVITPMKAFGDLPKTGFYVVCEQGAVWFPVVEGQEQALQVDTSIAVPDPFAQAVMAMAAERFSDTMFIDHTKLAMVSVEQRLDVSHELYVVGQRQFVEQTVKIGEVMGLPVIVGLPRPVDPVGTIRVHPTIISTDVEPAAVGKDLGAQRAWAMLERDGLLPKAWRCVGDSPSDILMADWLYQQGQSVRHLDVSLEGNAPDDRPFPVLRPAHRWLDDAGAAYLRWVLAKVNGQGLDEQDFDRPT